MRDDPPKLRSVALALGSMAENELAFLEGFRSAFPRGRGGELLVLTGGYETGLRRLAEAGELSAAVGDFISEEWIQVLRDRGIQVIQLANSCYLESTWNLCPDYRKMGEQAAQAFQRNGCAALAFLGIPGYFSSTCYGEGFARMAQNFSLPVTQGSSTSPIFISDFIRSLKKPLGIFAASDRLARMAVEAATCQALKVPQEVAIIGVGNRRLESLQAGIPLSSFELPSYELGKYAASLLQEIFNGVKRSNFSSKFFAARLHERESSLRGAKRGVAKAVAYIHSHLECNLDVGMLARVAGMSRRSFEMAMQQEYKISPARFIQQLRKQRAMELLTGGALSLAEIGRACGYPERSVFCAAFRRWTGLSTGEFRRAQRGKELLSRTSPSSQATPGECISFCPA